MDYFGQPWVGTRNCFGKVRVNGNSNVFTVCKNGWMILEEKNSLRTPVYNHVNSSQGIEWEKNELYI